MTPRELPSPLIKPACDPALWPLDPNLIFLNHGSFGSCPRAVLEFQREIQNRLERQPVQFFVRDLEGLLDQARSRLAEFLGADPADLVFVSNATSGVNTVLRSLQFEPGDELLVTNHEYNACRNALNFAAERSGARVIVATVPFPVQRPEQVVESILGRVTPRTRLALLDHVSSQTGLVFPIEQLVTKLAERGIETLIDGAHAPGMIPLNLRSIGAACYTGNCHKWLCAPKGAGFLWVRRGLQKVIRPLSISHGANSSRTDRSRFLIEFGWTGTWDPSPFLSVPEAVRCVGDLLPGGWPEVMKRNRELVLDARRILCRALNIESPCPDEMVGSLASFPIPDAAGAQPPRSPLYSDSDQDKLRLEHAIEVPIIPWPAPPKRLLRVSAQLYNSLPQYQRLAEALARIFPAASSPQKHAGDPLMR
ncbi:MAG: aminotransferase class V-fold PLP-dependent enzyme [Verrucomicrobia bacterium]|nr:aminotransferase class V-fold PLP-dependent enzyme [Verrucomicrobiota bacterium]